MITFTTAQLDAWLAAFMFPLARIFALMASAPVYNNAGIPMRTRFAVGLAHQTRNSLSESADSQ